MHRREEVGSGSLISIAGGAHGVYSDTRTEVRNIRATSIDLRPMGTRTQDGIPIPFSWRATVTVDEIPEHSKDYHILDLTRFNKERSWIYFGERDELVDFGFWHETNMQGYGGRLFTKYINHVWFLDEHGKLVQQEHSTEPHTGSWWKFNGPWSSRPGIMNAWTMRIPELGWPLSIDVTLKLAHSDSCSQVAANVTVGWLYDAIHRLGRQDDIQLVRADRPEEPTWEVRPHGKN